MMGTKQSIITKWANNNQAVVKVLTDNSKTTQVVATAGKIRVKVEGKSNG